jgi:hypothetical protein
MPPVNVFMSRVLRTARLTKLLAAMLLFSGVCSATPAAGEMNGSQPPAGTADPSRVTVEVQTHDGETLYATRYRAARGDCSITWIAYNNEPGVVKYEAVCPATLEEQLPLMNGICATFLGRDRNAPSFRTLFWGRLAPDSVTASREMSFRLAVAAFRSAEWDRGRGQPQHGDINRFTRDLANQARIYPELQELFSGFHRTVTLSHAEKVLVMKAERLPFFDRLKKLGVKAGDRLPFDCMAWFAVTIVAEQ